jgi:hypothetical protein
MKGLQNNYNTIENYYNQNIKENYWQSKINNELELKYKKYPSLKERYTENFGSFSIGAALKAPIKYPPEFLEGVS